MPDHNMSDPSNILEFKCLCCGDCCKKHGLYPVTSSDICRTSKGMGIGIDEFFSRYCTISNNDGRHGMFIKGNGLVCPFLKDDMCSIHEFKPEVCRIFPDPDGYVTVRRLKQDMKDATAPGMTGLSRCSVMDMPDDAILKGDIEATIDFRIREDTDRHYFASHFSIDPETMKFMSGLADVRLKDSTLRQAIKGRYSAIRSFHEGGTYDMELFFRSEQVTIERYMATYAAASGLITKIINPGTIIATFVNGYPGILLRTNENLPEDVESGNYLYKRIGNKGLFSILFISPDTAYTISFSIDTPCLDDIVKDDGKLHLSLKSMDKSLSAICREGIPGMANRSKSVSGQK